VRVEHYRLAYHDRWELDLDSLEAALSPRTRAVVLVQPNNPTGSCLSPTETDAVLSLAAERGIAVISDEVFGDFPWPPSDRPLASMLGETRALTFVLGGLSKACGMPQMKVAWIAARGPDPLKADALRKLEWIADLFLSVSTPVQLALPKLLDSRRPFQGRVRERLAANLARLRALDGREFRLLEGAGGWSAILSAPFSAATEALERGVLVHPGHFYEAPEDCVVVSLLPEPKVFDEAVSRLKSLA
jgi:alanine-synthesizing transaminase